jgi:hypothetical protein
MSTKDRNLQDIKLYRDFAEQCLHLANAAKTDHERQILLEMAATWKSLAEGAGIEKF